VRDENHVSNFVSSAIFYFQKMQQNFLISANSFVQRAGGAPAGGGSGPVEGGRRQMPEMPSMSVAMLTIKKRFL